MNKQTIISIFVVLVLIGAGAYWFYQADAKQQSFSSPVYGLSFDYSADYYLQTKEAGTVAQPQLAVVLVEDTPENRDLLAGQSTVAREGPTSINVDVYQNPKNLTPEEWARESTNWLLSDKATSSVVVGEETGLAYRWSGLYEGRSIIVTKNNLAYVFSVTRLTPEDKILTDFDKLLTSVKFPAPDNVTNINQTNNQKIMSHLITIKTNLGEIKIETYDADAPKTVENFVTLAKKGFYDGVIFHRVIDGFMIQGGDPTGTGMGGPGYKFEDELNSNTKSYQAGYKKGVVAMANAGPNTNGSQFFIMVADYPLPNDYTIFGKVVAGQEVADKIAKVAKDGADKPLSPVVMEKVTVEEGN